MQSGKTVLVTVHGTNDADPRDEGERWWQADSAFTRRLLENAPARTELVPFHWSGENSDIDRMHGAARLARLVRQRKQAGERVVLIGHSHGGNVVMEALAILPPDRSADRVVTLGTPFFTRKLKWLPLLLRIYQLMLGLAMIGFLSFVTLPARFSTFYNYIESGRTYYTWKLLLEVGFVAALILLGALLVAVALRAVWQSARRARRVRRALAPSDWLALFSPRDEAIRLLEAAATLNHTYVTRKACRRTLQGFSVLAGLVTSLLFVGWLYTDGQLAFLANPPHPYDEQNFRPMAVPILLMLFALGYVPGVLLFWMLSFAGGDWLLSRIANAGIRSGLIGAAYGADGRWLLTRVTAGPPYLPEVTARPLSATGLGGLTDEDMLAAARDLYDQVVGADSPELAVANPELLWAKLNDALYHNAYMKDDEVIAEVTEHLFAGPGTSV